MTSRRIVSSLIWAGTSGTTPGGGGSGDTAMLANMALLEEQAAGRTEQRRKSLVAEESLDRTEKTAVEGVDTSK